MSHSQMNRNAKRLKGGNPPIHLKKKLAPVLVVTSLDSAGHYSCKGAKNKIYNFSSITEDN